MKKNIKKTIFIIAVILFISLFLYFINSNKSEIDYDKENIKVITTLFPQYDFAKTIGGEKVDVSLLLPPGIEAHAFEPKPSDITKINTAHLFVYTGEFMEPWTHDIVASIDRDVKIVDASIGVSLMMHNHEEDHEKDTHLLSEGDNHKHDGLDPHIWLNFQNALIMVENIAKGLVEIDPENAEYYQNNLKNYQEKLIALDNIYRESLSNCYSKTIIYGGHYAFGYLANRYDLEYLSIQGFSPDAEPTAKEMINLVEKIKENNIGFIFYEELTSPKIAEIIAKETDAKLLLLNGAHNLTKKDYNEEVSFISIMEENLKNLSMGLRCKI